MVDIIIGLEDHTLMVRCSSTWSLREDMKVCTSVAAVSPDMKKMKIKTDYSCFSTEK